MDIIENSDVVEHFFGVYLLYCTNPKYKGKTYIGYTVNPERRIKQHNAGKKFGGAWKTNNKGPWVMVMIIHGFPNDISALRFEWAWQHPSASRRLKHVSKKQSRQKMFDFCLMVLSEMLKIGPWCRLPLTIRWLAPEFVTNIYPPMHMPITYGNVSSRKIDKNDKRINEEVEEQHKSKDSSIMLCSFCEKFVSDADKVTCVKPSCLLIAHLICLATVFRKDEMILPIEGTCPACDTNLLWGDLIRKKIGCYRHLEESSSESDVSDYYD